MIETVGDILSEAEGPQRAPTAAPLDIDGWPGPRIVFGMDDGEYQATPGLSASGIKSLSVTPMDFWSSTRWLNPNHDAEATASPYRELGTAYHKRILEGRDAFHASYAARLDKADFPMLLDTMEDMRAACVALGIKPPSTKAAAVDALIARNVMVPIWPAMEAAWEAANAGRIGLPRQRMDAIELAAAMIERHPQLSAAFRGGFAEVSIFWRCNQTGVPMKARIDYWKPRAIIDLKSVGNPMMMPFDRLVYKTIAALRYYTQAAVYHEAIEAAQSMIRDGYAPEIRDGAAGPDREWLDRAATEEPTFMFVFQQTGRAPVARGYVLPREGGAFRIGQNEAMMRKELFAEMYRTHGRDPWVSVEPVRNLADEEFPLWMGRE